MLKWVDLGDEQGANDVLINRGKEQLQPHERSLFHVKSWFKSFIMYWTYEFQFNMDWLKALSELYVGLLFCLHELMCCLHYISFGFRLSSSRYLRTALTFGKKHAIDNNYFVFLTLEIFLLFTFRGICCTIRMNPIYTTKPDEIFFKILRWMKWDYFASIKFWLKGNIPSPSTHEDGCTYYRVLYQKIPQPT